MTYHGHIENGVAILDAPVNLPDGTPVRIAIEPAGSGFWRRRTIPQLAEEQGVQAVVSVDELAGEWPAEDSVDEFLSLVRKVRS